jgi:hypothetical protein
MTGPLNAPRRCPLLTHFIYRTDGLSRDTRLTGAIASFLKRSSHRSNSCSQKFINDALSKSRLR